MTKFQIMAFFGLLLSQASGSPAGQVLGWGANASGQATGVPGSQSSTRAAAVQVAGCPLTNAVAVAAGYAHSLALKTDGTVVAWGSAFRGQATVPAGLRDVKAVAAGRNFSLALKHDGRVTAWGDNEFGQSAVPAALGDVVAIAAGMDWTLALRRNGTVTACGRNDATAPPELTNVVAIAAGGSRYQRNMALRKDGTLIAWGASKNATPPLGLNSVVAIAVGEYHSLALKSDGTVVGWGANASGEATGVATTNPPYASAGLVTIGGHLLTDVVDVSAGNEYGILGTGCRYSLAVKKDGTVVAWGHPPKMPAGLTNVVAVAAGQNFCLAIQLSDSISHIHRR